MMLPLLPPGFLRMASIAYLQPHQTPLTLLHEGGTGGRVSASDAGERSRYSAASWARKLENEGVCVHCGDTETTSQLGASGEKGKATRCSW